MQKEVDAGCLFRGGHNSIFTTNEKEVCDRADQDIRGARRHVGAAEKIPRELPIAGLGGLERWIAAVSVTVVHGRDNCAGDHCCVLWLIADRERTLSARLRCLYLSKRGEQAM